jgi:hypothetical protein
MGLVAQEAVEKWLAGTRLRHIISFHNASSGSATVTFWMPHRVSGFTNNPRTVFDVLVLAGESKFLMAETMPNHDELDPDYMEYTVRPSPGNCNADSAVHNTKVACGSGAVHVLP